MVPRSKSVLQSPFQLGKTLRLNSGQWFQAGVLYIECLCPAAPKSYVKILTSNVSQEVEPCKVLSKKTIIDEFLGWVH